MLLGAVPVFLSKLREFQAMAKAMKLERFAAKKELWECAWTFDMPDARYKAVGQAEGSA